MNLKSLCLKYNIDVQGIIQVGASIGQEFDEFLSLNPKKMLLIEPLPKSVKTLRGKTKEYSWVKVVEKAASNFDGTAILNVTSNMDSSSLLPLDVHKLVFTWIFKKAEEKVVCQKLDTILHEANENAFDFNLLYIDVQGAELLVLEGALETLKHIEAVHVEANYEHMYRDCVLEPELTKFLEGKGFKKVEYSTIKYFQNDIFYVRINQ